MAQGARTYAPLSDSNIVRIGSQMPVSIGSQLNIHIEGMAFGGKKH